MDTDVSCGADTSSGQGLKDDWRVQPRQARSSDIRLNIDPTKPQLGCLSHRLYWKDFLEKRLTYRYVPINWMDDDDVKLQPSTLHKGYFNAECNQSILQQRHTGTSQLGMVKVQFYTAVTLRSVLQGYLPGRTLWSLSLLPWRRLPNNKCLDPTYLLVPLCHVWSHFIGGKVKGHLLKLLLFFCESMSSWEQTVWMK